MSFELFITKRYIKSTKITGFISFITLISIIGVMLGTSALIIALSISKGFEKELKEKVIGFTSHIQVSKFDTRYFEKDDWESFEKVKMVSNVKSVSPFAGREAMIRSSYGIEGIYLKGILPEYDFSIIKRSIIEGEYNFDESDGIPKIIIGKKLANKLGVELGDKVIVLAIDPDSPNFSMPKIEQFKKVKEGIVSVSDIFTHFDSLLWIWGLSYLFVKLVNLQEQRHREEKLRMEQIKQYETQIAKLKALKDFTFSLRDLIYNPLTVIMSASARIERRFPYDNETLRDVRAIEQGCRRIEKLLMEVKEFEEKLVIGEETAGSEAVQEQLVSSQTK